MDWRFNTIWFEQLPADACISVDFGDKSVNRSSLQNANYILARGFKSKVADLTDFPAKNFVNFLNLDLANIRSFSGIGRLGKIKRLETHYCLKLESDVGLSEIGESLEWLHIKQSKKFSLGKELLALHNLRVLCLNTCSPLQDLEFLSLFPKLVDFRFVDTNVLSGDLTPILKHPTLCSVGFLNKKHYNIRDTEVDEHLKLRRKAAVAFAHKGIYETFRYLALGT